MVQRDQWDKYWGAKKLISKFAALRPTSHKVAAPAESCQSLLGRRPRGRLGSVLYTCTRLHRIRRRFKHFWSSISLSSPQRNSNFLALFAFKLSGSTRPPHRRRMRYRRLPTTRPTPRDRQEPICPRKKCAIWARWRPVPVKNVNYPRAPSSRRSGLVGPHTTPAIVNYKYMTSTRREGYFWLPTHGT